MRPWIINACMDKNKLGSLTSIMQIFFSNPNQRLILYVNTVRVEFALSFTFVPTVYTVSIVIVSVR